MLPSRKLLGVAEERLDDQRRRLRSTMVVKSLPKSLVASTSTFP